MTALKFHVRRMYSFLNYRRFAAFLALSLMVIPLIPFEVTATLQDSVWAVTFSPGESLLSKLKKAAHVRPSPAQIKWMERERITFIHYNMNTFTNSEWGTGKEIPKQFAPTAQDPAQWAQVVKSANMNMIIPTVKHHDGFCIWNTATTGHSIKNATVTTDVVDALNKGCVQNGVDMGIYLSPWDMYQRDTTKIWKTAAYNTFFINQLKELLGGAYGSIGECWFDGACTDYPTFQPAPQYTPSVWYDTIEALQPMSVIRLYDGFFFADTVRWNAIKQGTQKLLWRGKEIRWCGNEAGAGRTDEWAVQPVWTQFFGSQQQIDSLGRESFYNNAVGAVWYQSEVNTSLVNGQWFWHTGLTPRALSDLQTIYYNSVGDNANLLLNLAPDTRGLIPDNFIARIKQMNNWIDSTFTINLAKNATAIATAVNATPESTGHEAGKIIDNKKWTYWTTGGSWDISTSQATITFTLSSPQTFDHVMIKEFVYDGQRVADWSVEYQNASNTWVQLVRKKVIGHKRIIKFTSVTASKVRLNIFRSWDNPEISGFALCKSYSGIDTTKEDTTRTITGTLFAAPTASIQVQPKISVQAHRLIIDAMKMSIQKIEVACLNGRSVPSLNIFGSKAISQPLTSGVYMVKIRAGDRIFHKKIVVSQ